jgi:hypothetical protein
MNIWAPTSLKSLGTLNLPSFILEDWYILSEVDVDINVTNCYLVNSPGHFGTIKAKGKAKYLYLWNRGSCIFHTDSLITPSCDVLQQGQGDIYVNDTGRLHATIEDSGNVYYLGNPTNVTDTQKSSGKLIQLH